MPRKARQRGQVHGPTLSRLRRDEPSPTGEGEKAYGFACIASVASLIASGGDA